MIQVHTIEQRTMQQGSQPPVTIVREVALQNGKGVKKIQVLRGNTVVSAESEKLNLTEQKNVHKRKFMKGLYKTMERKTMKKLNASKKQVSPKKAATKKRATVKQAKAKKQQQ